MAYGLTTDGFVIKPLSVIRTEIEDAFKTAFGPSVDVSDESPLGQLAGIFAERESLLWELAEDVSSMFDPDEATGDALVALAAITGTIPDPATPSTVTLTLTGTPTTVVATGSVAAVDGTGSRFETTAPGTIVGETTHSDTTAYILGERTTSGGNVYRCTQAGTSGSGTPPTATDYVTEDTDGTCKWKWLGAGTGSIDVAAESQDNGPIVAASETLIDIVTPVAGWDNVVNVLDADLGSVGETDEELRVKRETELSSGNAVKDAIRRALLDVADVTSATIFVNDTDTTDGDGVPPHAFEALVEGGVDQDIWDAIFDSKACGIRSYGTESGTVTDEEGQSHTEQFSRPTEIDIYVDITLEYDANAYPDNGDDQIADAIVAWGDARGTGYDAVSSAIKAACFTVPGVLDVSLAYIDTSPAPASEATIAISTREKAIYDTGRITVTSAAGTP